MGDSVARQRGLPHRGGRCTATGSRLDVVAETLRRTALGSLARRRPRQPRAAAAPGRPAGRPPGAGPRRRRRDRIAATRGEGESTVLEIATPAGAAPLRRREGERRGGRGEPHGRGAAAGRVQGGADPPHAGGDDPRPAAAGGAVNLEVDLVAKYVEALVAPHRPAGRDAMSSSAVAVRHRRARRSRRSAPGAWSWSATPRTARTRATWSWPPSSPRPRRSTSWPRTAAGSSASRSPRSAASSSACSSMVRRNEAPHAHGLHRLHRGPRTGVTTGISAADRSRTIMVAIDPNAGPEDLVEARARLPAAGQARRRAGARRPHRGGGGPGAAGRAHPGGRDLRGQQRRRHDGARPRPGRRYAAEHGLQDHHDRPAHRAPPAHRAAHRARHRRPAAHRTAASSRPIGYRSDRRRQAPPRPGDG